MGTVKEVIRQMRIEARENAKQNNSGFSGRRGGGGGRGRRRR